MRSFATPTADQVRRALAALGRVDLVRHFFDGLENPNWVRPLQKQGAFSHPPGHVRDETGGWTVPVWPASRYLARMAEADPQAVLDAALSIPNTENEYVHTDLAQAALKMPAELAAQWVRAEIPWLQQRSFLYGGLSHYLGPLVAHLARGGAIDAAFELAGAALEILPTPPAADDDDGHRPLPEPRGRVRDWDYAEMLRAGTPALVEADAEHALRFFGDLLDAGIAASRPDARADDDEDFSFLWRSAIGTDDPDHTERIVWSLSSAVRDAALHAARSGEAAARRVVEALEARRWLVYRRIALHVLDALPNAPAQLVAERLTDEGLFEEDGLRYEYLALLRRRFVDLSAAHQRTILGWIDARCDADAAEAEHPSGYDAAEIADRRRLHLLGVVGHALPEPWRTHYGELEARYGPPAPPEPLGIRSGWVGDQTPKTGDELRAMSPEALIRYVEAWRAEDRDPFGPSRSGLIRTMTEVVASDPAPYAGTHLRPAASDAAIVGGLLSAFRSATEAGRPFDWEPVLELCTEATSRADDEDQDAFEATWISSRGAVAHLLSAGFDAGDAMVPFVLRERVWAVLHPLTNDPQPSVEYEARYGGTNMDPATLSLNTVRGEAMHAVVRYALWVRRHLDPEAGSPAGFAAMPEVREVLDEHLHVERDPSLAVRSVYGWWLPYLFALDPAWTTERVGRIFPDDPELIEFRGTAWAAYVNFSRPGVALFHLLRREYEAAFRRMGVPRPAHRHFDHADDRSGQHLLAFLWQGHLDLDDDVLTIFFARAPARVRGEAIGFVGRSLQAADEPPPHEVAARLQRLWEARLAAARASRAVADHTPEVAAFGWWFASGKLDAAWSIEQLQAALALHPEMEVDHLVVERLHALARQFPVQTVACLERLANGGRWALLSWRDEAVHALRAVLTSGDAQAAEAARALANTLGELGHGSFRVVGS